MKRPVSRFPAPPVGGPPIAGTAVQRTAQPLSYRITIGTYMHQAPGLPPEAAGHSFVSVQGPGGRRETWGFSPATDRRFDDFRNNRSQFHAGVPGVLHRDDASFAKPGVVTRSYAVGPVQARQALAKIAEYRSRRPAFSFAGRDCGVFAGEVMSAAGIGGYERPGVTRPADMHRVVRWQR